jgi:hypothetical protein
MDIDRLSADTDRILDMPSLLLQSVPLAADRWRHSV